MSRAALLTVLLWIAPCLAHAAEGFDQPMAASVFSAGLAFIAPRILEAESVPQLTLWGLRGLTAIDPALAPELRETEIRLLQAGKPIFSAPLPDGVSTEGWGAVAAGMAAATGPLVSTPRAVATQAKSIQRRVAPRASRPAVASSPTMSSCGAAPCLTAALSAPVRCCANKNAPSATVI